MVWCGRWNFDVVLQNLRLLVPLLIKLKSNFPAFFVFADLAIYNVFTSLLIKPSFPFYTVEGMQVQSPLPIF